MVMDEIVQGKQREKSRKEPKTSPWKCPISIYWLEGWGAWKVIRGLRGKIGECHNVKETKGKEWFKRKQYSTESSSDTERRETENIW